MDEERFNPSPGRVDCRVVAASEEPATATVAGDRSEVVEAAAGLAADCLF